MMRVLLESIGGIQFSVEIGDSCTLQQLKEKVRQALDFPIARQILSLNGNILREDAHLLDVKHGSVIKFRFAPDPELVDLITLDIWPTERMTVKACGDDTVYELKEKIQKQQGIPADQILLTTEDGTELPDYKRLRDCDWETGMSLEFLPVPRPKRSTSSTRLLMMMSLDLQFKLLRRK